MAQKTSKQLPNDWRADVLQRVRALIRQADPDVTEEVKWRKPSNPAGVPVWSHNGVICTGETYKNAVKLTFARGAALDDPARLFNAGLDGNTRRAIDIHEGDTINGPALKALVRAAVALNSAGKKPARLAGGNPQIAKADGERPVQKYIAAMPGWKRDVGRRLDALISRTVPGVRKAVKWNSPFYGVDDRGWFLAFHVFTRYVQVTFFQGASLRPVPPRPSKDKNVRYLDIHENDQLDERGLASWIKQASRLPGWSGRPGR